jgi:Glycosyl transferase family 2
MDNRVSFIITARNEDPAIVAATVQGILATVGDAWCEIVIVDDASAQAVDVTAAGVTIVRQPESVGVTRARLIGTKVSTGNVLIWVDAHMTFEPGWLDAMLREVDSGALLCAPWRNYTRTCVHSWGSDFAWCGERAYERALRPGFDFSPRRRPPRGHSGVVPMVIGACYAMRRDSYARMGGFCPLFRTYGGDEPDLSARAWLSGGSVRCVRSAGIGHLDRLNFPYPVSFSDVEFNQVVMIRSLFDEATAALLEEFFEPLPDEVKSWLAEADVTAWRSEVQSRRRLRDADFFRRIAPRVPISFGSAVRFRRNHLPTSRIRTALAAEERTYAASEGESHSRSADEVVVLPTSKKLIQAGVVVWEGKAIILPGGPETGRRALVSELVRAGATLYSDSFAVLDSDGMVYPYCAEPGQSQPVHAGLIASIQFYPGRHWRLDEVSPAVCALDLLANAVGVRDAVIFRAVNHAIRGIVALQGRRGPAGPVSRALVQYRTRMDSLAPI